MRCVCPRRGCWYPFTRGRGPPLPSFTAGVSVHGACAPQTETVSFDGAGWVALVGEECWTSTALRAASALGGAAPTRSLAANGHPQRLCAASALGGAATTRSLAAGALHCLRSLREFPFTALVRRKRKRSPSMRVDGWRWLGKSAGHPQRFALWMPSEGLLLPVHSRQGPSTAFVHCGCFRSRRFGAANGNLSFDAGGWVAVREVF